MKKRFGLFTVLLLSLTLILAACGGKDKNEKNASGDQPYEIKWYMIGTPQKDTEKVFEKVNEYTKEKINATVKLTQIDWGDYDQKMQVIISSGEPFDIAYTSGGTYVQDAQKGAFLALDDLLEKEGKDLNELLNPALLEGVRVNGNVYGIPSNKEAARQKVFTFNKNLVDKYNFDLSNVKTLEDLEKLNAEKRTLIEGRYWGEHSWKNWKEYAESINYSVRSAYRLRDEVLAIFAEKIGEF